jgi:transcriptional regulator with XRE-family HTH domain
LERSVKLRPSIGRRVRELRGKERQDDFAPALGITQGQLSKIERGFVAPSVEVLLRLRERSERESFGGTVRASNLALLKLPRGVQGI